MLVLTRRVDESIVIGEDVVVTVVAVDGDRVRLGIQAPRSVTILRHELYQAVEAQNRAAATRAREREGGVAPILGALEARLAGRGLPQVDMPGLQGLRAQDGVRKRPEP